MTVSDRPGRQKNEVTSGRSRVTIAGTARAPPNCGGNATKPARSRPKRAILPDLPDGPFPAISGVTREIRKERPGGRPLGLEMSQVIKSVCVYCGASNGASESFLKIATDVGRALAENGIRLVYGGGGIGLMGAVADAALAAGGEVIGIIPEHLQQAELGHRGLTDLKIVDSMHT